MKYFILVVALTLVGCTTTPIQGVVEGGLLGNGEKNILNQMNHIAYHAALVRDPEMTDDEFKAWLKSKNQDEFREWVARIEYEQKRIKSLFSLYAAVTNTDSTDYTILRSYNKAMKKSYDNLTEAQVIYHAE
jgi:hypothetical protein